jgi:hypothetical protein
VFTGPNLHKAIYSAAMVPNPDRTGVVLIGGNPLNDEWSSDKDLYELKCSSSSCNWSPMEQKLNVARNGLVAMYGPDSFADCEN